MVRFYTLWIYLYLFSLSVVGQKAYSKADFTPKMRIIVDNDFSGDPDGLFQLAHLILSPSVEIRGIIGSHLSKGDGFDPSDRQADHAVQKARELLQLMQINLPVVAGSNVGMTDEKKPVASAGVDMILKEAARTDTSLPLYVVCGAGLTEMASALIRQPDIAHRITLIWIGGPEYPNLGYPPPNPADIEYNLNIDRVAAQVVFNQSNLPIWQIPRNTNRQALVSFAQLWVHVRPKASLGLYLFNQLENLMKRVGRLDETYILGDNPLVLLTALQSYFEPDPSSSFYQNLPAPTINSKGQYEPNPDGRPIRVYYHLDCHLMFQDFFDKLTLWANAQPSETKPDGSPKKN